MQSYRNYEKTTGSLYLLFLFLSAFFVMSVSKVGAEEAFLKFEVHKLANTETIVSDAEMDIIVEKTFALYPPLGLYLKAIRNTDISHKAVIEEALGLQAASKKLSGETALLALLVTHSSGLSFEQKREFSRSFIDTLLEQINSRNWFTSTALFSLINNKETLESLSEIERARVQKLVYTGLIFSAYEGSALSSLSVILNKGTGTSYTADLCSVFEIAGLPNFGSTVGCVKSNKNAEESSAKIQAGFARRQKRQEQRLQGRYKRIVGDFCPRFANREFETHVCADLIDMITTVCFVSIKDTKTIASVGPLFVCDVKALNRLSDFTREINLDAFGDSGLR